MLHKQSRKSKALLLKIADCRFQIVRAETEAMTPWQIRTEIS